MPGTSWKLIKNRTSLAPAKSKGLPKSLTEDFNKVRQKARTQIAEGRGLSPPSSAPSPLGAELLLVGLLSQGCETRTGTFGFSGEVQTTVAGRHDGFPTARKWR